MDHEAPLAGDEAGEARAPAREDLRDEGNRLARRLGDVPLRLLGDEPAAGVEEEDRLAVAELRVRVAERALTNDGERTQAA